MSYKIVPSAATEGPKPLAVTIEAACKIVGVGRTTMWALIKDGRVKSATIGRRRLVIFASLEALLNQDAGGAP